MSPRNDRKRLAESLDKLPTKLLKIMPKLILLRHLKSQWNLENRFAGWTDGPLCQEGKEMVGEIAGKLSQFKVDPVRSKPPQGRLAAVPLAGRTSNGVDKIYTSPLFRNQDTIARILERSEKYPFFIHLDKGKMQKWGHFTDISEGDVPVFVSEKLNERYYGKLQGLNKDEAKKQYGEEKVRFWRRSYEVAPPGGESLKDVIKRTIPFYKKYVEKDLKAGENVLIVASHNSLRAIAKIVEKISDKDIIDLEIPYAGIIEYELDESLGLKNKRTL